MPESDPAILPTARQVALSKPDSALDPRRAAPGVETSVVSPPVAPEPRLFIWIESLALLILGWALLGYLYHASTPGPADEIGLPGHDAFYHTKMAEMLSQAGLMKQFPWLQFAYFRRAGNDFVSHHYGFHVILLPFVYAAQYLTGDAMAGGRWACRAFFGLNLLLFNLLLRFGGVRARWFWITLFLLMPEHFFTRHAFVRAMGPSLALMFLTLLMLYRRRWLWAALCVGAYVHVYLGAVLYAPVIVALLALAMILAPQGEREWPWKMVLWTAGGWLLGVVTYPYARGMAEFLYMQVFGTGLTPDIEVGQEWLPYNNTWWFVGTTASVLFAWTAALFLRLRLGGRLNAVEAHLLLVNFVFLLLTLKARRFIEYWPPFGLLSAAYMIAPFERESIESLRRLLVELGPALRRGMLSLGVFAAVAFVAALFALGVRRADTLAMLSSWPLWAFVVAALSLIPLTRASTMAPVPAGASSGGALSLRLAWVPLGGALIVGGFFVLAFACRKTIPPARIGVTAWQWGLLAAAYLFVPWAAWHATRRRMAEPGLVEAPLRAAGILAGGLALSAAALVGGASHYADIARQLRCNFDLKEVRAAMDFLKSNSPAHSIVFTDDWDIFPVYFYFNTHNYYIVGLDPKFTQERRPDLWERYVRISRGEAPKHSTYTKIEKDRSRHSESIDIRNEDIRDDFNTSYVVCDRDHRALADKLAQNKQLAELIYPERVYSECRNAAFVIFRIRPAGEVPPPASRPAEIMGRVYLDSRQPVAVEQGWGDLVNAQSVESRPMRLHGIEHVRGLGTHAPSRLVYRVPEGCDTFDAIVGIDDETNGRGSVIVRVLLDDATVFESQTLNGGDPPAIVHVPLAGASRLTLIADPTGDGNRFDHVDWASAHFARPGAARPQRESAPPGDQP